MARSQPPQKSKPSTPKPKPTPNSKPKGGKPAAPAAKASTSSAPPPAKGKQPQAAVVDSLRQEILDLGGDEEDYAMLQNVDEGDGEVVGGDDEVVDVSFFRVSSSSTFEILESSPFFLSPSFGSIFCRPSSRRSSLRS